MTPLTTTTRTLPQPWQVRSVRLQSTTDEPELSWLPVETPDAELTATVLSRIATASGAGWIAADEAS